MHAAGVRNLLDTAVVSDVAGIDADLVHSGNSGFQCKAVIEMDIRYNRNAHGLLEGGDEAHRIHVRHGGPDNIAARGLESLRLTDAALDIGRRHAQHGLYGNRSAAANGNASHFHLSAHCVTLPIPGL